MRKSRTYQGVNVQLSKSVILPESALDTFRHAVSAYGHLCLHGETLTAQQWINRIQATYSMTPRIDHVIGAIKTVAAIDG